MDALFTLLSNLLPRGMGETIGVALAAALTLMIFSYLFGDNLLFRTAQHILVGVTAAYAVVIAFHDVIIAQLLTPLRADFDNEWPLLVPLALGILLLAKTRPATAWLGNLSMAFMLGVGVALSLNGALFGTLIPQVQAMALPLLDIRGELETSEQVVQFFNSVVLSVGTIGVLLAFHYGRGGNHIVGWAFNTLLRLWGNLGRGFIWIAFGTLFAGLVLSRVTLLVSRVQFLLVEFIGRLIRF